VCVLLFIYTWPVPAHWLSSQSSKSPAGSAERAQEQIVAGMLSYSESLVWLKHSSLTMWTDFSVSVTVQWRQMRNGKISPFVVSESNHCDGWCCEQTTPPGRQAGTLTESLQQCTFAFSRCSFLYQHFIKFTHKSWWSFFPQR